MPDSDHIYVIDVDVLARIHVRKDSNEIYAGLIGLAEDDRLITVRQTFDELKKFGAVYEILKGKREEFELLAEMQFTEAVSKIIDILGKEAPYLYEATGGKNPDPADPCCRSDCLRVHGRYKRAPAKHNAYPCGVSAAEYWLPLYSRTAFSA